MATHISKTGVCTLSEVLDARFSRYSWMTSGLPSTTVDVLKIRKWMMSPVRIEGALANYSGLRCPAHHTE